VSDLQEDFSFKQFAKGEFYVNVNSHLVDEVGLKPGQKIVDLACGTGQVTRMIAEKVTGTKDSIVIGMDASSVALKEAMAHLSSVKDTAIQFIQSQIEQFSESVKDSVDAVLLCNAIHYISDKDDLITQVGKRLKTGGLFAFNTSFFSGSHPPSTEEFYRKWMFKALRILKTQYNLRPIKSEKVQSRVTLSEDQYASLIQKNGLKVIKQKINLVNVPLQGWLDISTFEDFIQGVMPGVSLDKASASLTQGVKEAFNELNLNFVPRNWLEVVAIKEK
jgi:ubiquinone/menaquinone biosynthesis C-methylase UbiE